MYWVICVCNLAISPDVAVVEEAGSEEPRGFEFECGDLNEGTNGFDVCILHRPCDKRGECMHVIRGLNIAEIPTQILLAFAMVCSTAWDNRPPEDEPQSLDVATVHESSFVTI